MKRIFIAFLLSSTVQASNLQLELKDFNLEYRNPRGDARASSVQIGDQKKDEVAVLIEKFENSFSLILEGTEEEQYEFKNAPELLTEATHMSIQNLDISLNKEVKMELARASFISDEEFFLQNFRINCARSKLNEVTDQIIEGCMQKMDLKTSRLSSHKISAFLEQTMSGVGVNNLEIVSRRGKFDLSAQIKAQISGKAKIRGEASYDSKKRIISLKISRVQFGILNITSKFFTELKKNEGAKMKVKKPYVYLYL